MFYGQRLGELCAWLFNWVLRVAPTVQRTDLLGVSGGNASRIAGGNPLDTQEKHVVPTQRGCGSLSNSGPRTSHRQLQKSLDWRARSVVWTSKSPGLILLDFFLRGYMKSSTYSSSDNFEVAAGGTSVIFLRAHVNFCCLNFGFELRPIILRLNICSKLVITATFFQNTSVLLLDFHP